MTDINNTDYYSDLRPIIDPINHDREDIDINTYLYTDWTTQSQPIIGMSMQEIIDNTEPFEYIDTIERIEKATIEALDILHHIMTYDFTN